MFPKYPETVLVKRRPEIFSVKEVIATEKLNGSNFRLHFPCGMESIDGIGYGSREVEYTPGKPFPLNRSRELFNNQPEHLTLVWEVVKSYGFPDTTIFGEVYGPGIKTRGVKYLTGDTPRFRAFGLMIGENFVTYDLFCEVLDKMKLPRVHEIWRGPPSMEAFDALLEKPSTEGLLNGVTDPDNIAEGVVIQSNPLLRNVFGEWLIVKHKAKKFSEKAHASIVKAPRETTPTDVFVQTWVTEARVHNAIGRLHDRGTPLEGTMRDMPALLTEIIADLHKECEPSSLNDKQLKGTTSKVLGPIYRQILSGD